MNEKEMQQGSISVDELLVIIGRKEVQIQMLNNELMRLQQQVKESQNKKTNKE